MPDTYVFATVAHGESLFHGIDPIFREQEASLLELSAQHRAAATKREDGKRSGEGH